MLIILCKKNIEIQHFLLRFIYLQNQNNFTSWHVDMFHVNQPANSQLCMQSLT